MFKMVVPFACALAVAGVSPALAKKDDKIAGLRRKCEKKEQKIESLKKLIEAEVKEGNQRIELWIPEKRTTIDLEKATEKELEAVKEIRGKVLDLLKETAEALGIKKPYGPKQQKQN